MQLIRKQKRADVATYESNEAITRLQKLQNSQYRYQTAVSRMQREILVLCTAIVRDRKYLFLP